MITYVDGQKDEINVSDDDDLLTAYDVARNELQGNLKLSVHFKPAAVKLALSLEEEKVAIEEKTSTKKKVTKEKKVKESKKKAKKVDTVESGSGDKVQTNAA